MILFSASSVLNLSFLPSVLPKSTFGCCGKKEAVNGDGIKTKVFLPFLRGGAQECGFFMLHRLSTYTNHNHGDSHGHPSVLPC